jgi:hypothetical protein
MFASPPSAVAASLALMTVRVPPDGNEPVEMLQPPRSAVGATSAKKKERVEREIIEGTSDGLLHGTCREGERGPSEPRLLQIHCFIS